MNSVTTSENMMGLPLVNTMLAAAGGIAAKKTLGAILSTVRSDDTKQETKGVDMVGVNGPVVDDEAVAAKRATDKKADAVEEWIKANPSAEKQIFDEVCESLSSGAKYLSSLGDIGRRHEMPKGLFGAWVRGKKALLGVKAINGAGSEMVYLVEKVGDSAYMATLGSQNEDGEISRARGTLRSSTPASSLFCAGFVKYSRGDSLVAENPCLLLNRAYRPDGTPLKEGVYQLRSQIKDGDFAIGFNRGEKTFIFDTQGAMAPVQVIPWSGFEESKECSDAVAYFKQNPIGVLTTSRTAIIGNDDYPGRILILDDGVFDRNVCLKGFESIGHGKVRHFDVRLYAGEYRTLTRENQGIDFKYPGETFGLLVPPRQRARNDNGARYDHPVLDRLEWVGLDGQPNAEKGFSVNPDAFDDSELKEDHSDVGGQNPEVNMRVHEVSRSVSETSHEVPTQELEKADALENPREDMVDGVMPASINPQDGGWCACLYDEDEVHFLNSIIQDAERCGYKYRAQDIIRFHTSVKLGAFTLLGGAPGCGKSTLVGLYARALAGSKTAGFENGLLKIDVNPAWMEPNDILGYWNLKGEYAPASSRLVPYLRAADGADRVGLVCLEEMNLARVEHYFSDFLQLMSRPADDRWLEGVPAEPTGGSRDAARLRISEKLRFVGTNNFDETTHRFSARFYDRCNYIELQKPDLTSVFPEQVPSFEKGRYESPVDWLTYSKWRRDISIAEVEPGVIDKSKTLFDAMDPLGLAPSQRVRFAILEYIVNRPFYPGCGSDVSDRAICQMTALDEAIVQRILPRYTLNYLREESGARDKLLSLLQDFPLSHKFFEAKCFPGERPSRA